jgi:hypothetical protein
VKAWVVLRVQVMALALALAWVRVQEQNQVQERAQAQEQVQVQVWVREEHVLVRQWVPLRVIVGLRKHQTHSVLVVEIEQRHR